MNLDILDKPLLKSLLNETIYFHNIMNAYSIRTSIACNLPAGILGLVYASRKGNYHLVLNGNANHETQCKTFIHEIKHIAYDLPKIGYVIGLDMQHTYLENEADRVAEDTIRYSYKNKSLG